MEIIRQAWLIFLLMIEEIATGLEEEKSLADLVERLQGAVNGFMCGVYRLVLEKKDRLLREVPEWWPGLGGGAVGLSDVVDLLRGSEYTRTYYWHRETEGCVFN